MKSKKIVGWIVAAILVCALAVSAVLIVMNFDAIKTGLSGGQLYTQEDMDEAHETWEEENKAIIDNLTNQNNQLIEQKEQLEIEKYEEGYNAGYSEGYAQSVIDKDGNAVGTVWDGRADTSWYNETDTSFEINSAEDLAGLSYLVAFGNTFDDKTITLTSDIYLNDPSVMFVDGAFVEGNYNVFYSIGQTNNFSGVLDGDGHTIYGLYQDYALNRYGLFGNTLDASVVDLTIDSAYIKVNYSNSYAGVGVGYATGALNLTNFDVTNSAIVAETSASNVGGLIGGTNAMGNLSMAVSYCDVDVTIATMEGASIDYVGGLLGYANIGSTGLSVEYGSVDVNFTAIVDYYAGGLIGRAMGGTVDVTGTEIVVNGELVNQAGTSIGFGGVGYIQNPTSAVLDGLTISGNIDLSSNFAEKYSADIYNPSNSTNITVSNTTNTLAIEVAV